MLRYDTCRAFRLPVTVFSIICLIVIGYSSQIDVLREVWEKGELLEHGWTLKFVESILYTDSLRFILPIISALPFAAEFIDERKSGMTRAAVSRTNRWRYVRSKTLVTALSGGGIVAAGICVLLSVSMLIFKMVEQPAAVEMTGHEEMQTFLMLLLRYVLCGALYAELGLFFSILLNHRYMAWLSPFMCYYLLIILHERYITGLYILYPAEWMQPERVWGENNWQLCGWLLLLVGLTGMGVIKTGMRRLEHV